MTRLPEPLFGCSLVGLRLNLGPFTRDAPPIALQMGTMSATSIRFAASQLVELLSGPLKIPAVLFGDPARSVTGIRGLESATNSDLSFLAPTSKRRFAELRRKALSGSAGILLVEGFDPEVPTTQIVTANPFKAVVALSRHFVPELKVIPGIDPRASVDDSATIGAGVSIGAFAVVGSGVVIGQGTIIHPHAVIYPQATVGANCVIHSGAVVREHVMLGNDCILQNGVVLGGDGFGYFYEAGTGHIRIPHIGTLVVQDGVDFGANATVDRATLGETRIGAGTKIDNLVMVGHNTTIGRGSLLCAQVGISGSCEVGNGVVLGGNAGVGDHIRIGDGARAAGKTGIIGDVPAKTDVAGYPHAEASEWRRSQALVRQLPRLVKEVRMLRKLVGLPPAAAEEEESAT